MRVAAATLLAVSLPFAPGAAAAAADATEACLLEALRTAAPEVTVAELRARCASEGTTAAPAVAAGPAQPAEAGAVEPGAVARRLARESELDANPWSLQVHRQNYFMPITWDPQPNEEPFRAATPAAAQPLALDAAEAKFQLSVKMPVIRHLFGVGDLYAAYTGTSWWQMYNREFSSPFRETNHEPEVFLAMPTGWRMAGFRLPVMTVGFAHQSNGRSQPLSRSWNRVYAQFIAERGNLALAFKPWYRLPESRKRDPLDADGDDNPDITDYLGHFELGAAWRRDDQVLALMWRRNLGAGHGAFEVSWSAPLRGNLRWYAQYFEGYGESLIDYDAYTRRIGVGVAFGDVL